jgi:hypothetical protein
MKANNIAKYGLIVVLIVPVIFLLSRNINRKYNAKYTIGITTGSEGGGWVGYNYRVNNLEYNGSRESLKFYPTKKGGRYYVEFSSKSHDVSVILWDQPVPDHINEAPLEGWEDIPQ